MPPSVGTSCDINVIYTLPNLKCPMFSQQTSPAVAHVVAGIVTIKLWQCHSCGYSHIHAWSDTICAQCSSKDDTRKTEVRPCYSTAPDLHWLSAPECIKIWLAVFVFCCHSHTMPAYLARDLQSCTHWATNNNSRQLRQSSATHKLVMPRTRYRTVCDRAFGVAEARLWNNLPLAIHSVASLNIWRPISSSRESRDTAADILSELFNSF